MEAGLLLAGGRGTVLFVCCQGLSENMHYNAEGKMENIPKKVSWGDAQVFIVFFHLLSPHVL